MGPFPERSTDVDVVRDLMIHDLDIIQRLVGGEEPERVDAVGVPVLTDRVDIANARLTFPCGAVANCTASRVSPTPMRKIRLFQLDGYFSIDFLEQAVAIARRLESGPDGGREIDLQRLEIDPEDALVQYNVACIYAQLGENEQALDCLEASYQNAVSVDSLKWMEEDPYFDPVRDHPRYKALLAKLDVDEITEKA